VPRIVLSITGTKATPIKKHSSDLLPYPPELIPFTLLDGANTRYGQLYKPIFAHPFKEARIKGFMPCQPYQVTTNHLAIVGRPGDFHWPSLLELNDDIAPFCWGSDEKFKHYTAAASINCHPVMATGPPPSVPMHAIPEILAIHLLTAAIIWSSNHLFFASHSIGSNEAQEWRLVRVTFEDFILIYPSCTQDGQFLFEFYAAIRPIGNTMQ
jgi:hypothetical protein